MEARSERTLALGKPGSSCWLSSLLQCKRVHLDAALGGSTVILNRDLRVENGLFISIICFLDGGLSRCCIFFFFSHYANCVLRESSHCGDLQSNGYRNDSMNYFLSLSN